MFAKTELIPSLTCILESLDKFNIIAPGFDKEENDELLWPGFIHSQGLKQPEEAAIIRKADLENHNKDGGLWIVIKGKVYDVQDWRGQAPCGSDTLRDFAFEDATQAFEEFQPDHFSLDTQRLYEINPLNFLRLDRTLYYARHLIRYDDDSLLLI